MGEGEQLRRSISLSWWPRVKESMGENTWQSNVWTSVVNQPSTGWVQTAPKLRGCVSTRGRPSWCPGSWVWSHVEENPDRGSHIGGEERETPCSSHCGWAVLSGVGAAAPQVPARHIPSQFQVQSYYVSLKSASVRVFTPWKVANVTNRGFSPWRAGCETFTGPLLGAGPLSCPLVFWGIGVGFILCH